jgi:putative AbiEii toxin of type IV toxin-antitoxin system
VIVTRMAQARRLVDRQRGEAIALAEQGKMVLQEIADLNQVIDLHEKAAHVLTAIGEQRQDSAQRQIELLVTQGLQTIFDDGLSFHLVPGVRAKTPVVDFVVRSTMADGTLVETDVMAARGGGLAATVGFLLRLVVLLLSRARQDTVLFLDETFAHVSADYLPRLIEFLKDLVARTGVQIVLVTHDESFQDAADVVYKLQLVDGVTRATRL